MNLTYFYPQIRVNVVNKDNNPVSIRFVIEISDIIIFSENIRSDVKTSEGTTLICALHKLPSLCSQKQKLNSALQ